jgi:CAAX prenyl protease-like protein
MSHACQLRLRSRVAFELATLALLTSVYLLVVPHRPVWLDAGLGLVGLALVAATARNTREHIWGAPATDRRQRLRRSWRHMLIATSGVALIFALIGSWTGRARPLFTATMLGALVFFTLWATLQQVLFQFYLLGRLRVVIPASPPVTLAVMNGLLFGAVHLPDVEVTVLTSIAGAVWSWYYLRDRCLGPIAMSHAVLGTAYYYWIRGDDLLLRWFSATHW